MDDFSGSIFNKKTIQRLTQNIVITPEQEKQAAEWIQKIEKGELSGETNQYLIFANKILDKILGYDIDKIIHNDDNVEYQYADCNGKKVLCIEAKGTKTKSLFDIQNRPNKAHRTPISQTWDYMRTGDLDWGICTNYKYFALIKRNEKGKGYLFNFEDIKKNPDNLKEFIGIFSREHLVDKKSVDTLYSESIIEEKEFTKEFYKLYHETRLMLKIAFEKEGVTKNDAIYFTQIFLDRLIFIFFVSDKGYISDKKLFTNRVLKLLELDVCTQHSKKIYDEITELFTAFDKGDDDLGVFGFNGGLFNSKFPERINFIDFEEASKFSVAMQNSNLKKSTKLNTQDSKVIQKFKNRLNPIIENLLLLDSFDFNTEVNVNILGHIFEQSISDLEELNRELSSKRKKDGVYYTPSNLTDYICKNTIIPYFSKKGVNTVADLIEEYFDNIDDLDQQFRQIKILDPACGSGAFLIKAVDTLLEIGQGIQSVKELQGQYSAGTDLKLTKWNEQDTTREIIENSIYGVDVNRESVGITKLSLFLKLAAQDRKLIGLSKNILVGNSLIDDPTIDHLAFPWKERFPNVFLHPDLRKHLDNEHKDGFDIIIGNPPWQILKPDVDEFFTPIYNVKEKSNKFSLLTKPQKNRFVKKCLEEPETNSRWKEYIDRYNSQIEYVSNEKHYQFQTQNTEGKKSFNRIDINLYKLFIEKFHQLLKENGIAGIVVPSGICSDLGTKGLRKLLFEKHQILELCGFINRKPIFEDVHRQFKFCTLLFKKGGSTKTFQAKFSVYDDDTLQIFKENSFEYDLDIVKTSAPNSLSIMECKDERELQIFKKLYKFPLLQSEEWNVKGSREFDMTDDANLFHTGNVGPPLYEGKMMNMFTHDFSNPRYWLDEQEATDKLKKTELNRIKKLTKQKSPLTIPRIDANEYRLVWRKITNSTNERTLISTILYPNVFLGNSLYYIHPITFDGKTYIKPISNEETLFLCGVFNSFPIDFILRHKVGTNLTVFHLMELPVPRFDIQNPYHQKIFQNSAKLICTSDKYSELQKLINVSESVTEPSERIALEAQINAYVAKIYDLTKEDLDLILENFPIVNKKLKELTLDEFDLLN